MDKNEYLSTFSPSSINICLNISNACNLRCTYCFNHNKSGKVMTEEIAYEAIDKMFEMFPNCDKYFVDLRGKGEPLLNLPIIFKIKEYCTKKSDQINREILVNFVTNGVLLTPRVAKTLQDKGIFFVLV